MAARREYEAIHQCASELHAMLDVDLFLAAGISLNLVSLDEGKKITKELKRNRMAAIVCILELLKTKRNCFDVFVSALRKSVERHLDQQHSHFQLITALVRKRDELQAGCIMQGLTVPTCHPPPPRTYLCIECMYSTALTISNTHTHTHTRTHARTHTSATAIYSKS